MEEALLRMPKNYKFELLPQLQAVIYFASKTNKQCNTQKAFSPSILVTFHTGASDNVL